MGGEQYLDSAPVLMVSTGGPGRLLRAGTSYSLGRDPGCDIVFDDPRVSWRHAVLRLDQGGWLLEDAGSRNGIFAGTQRVTRMWIAGDCLARLADCQDGPPLWCRRRRGSPATPTATPNPCCWSWRSARAWRARPAGGRQVFLILGVAMGGSFPTRCAAAPLPRPPPPPERR